MGKSKGFIERPLGDDEQGQRNMEERTEHVKVRSWAKRVS